MWELKEGEEEGAGRRNSAQLVIKLPSSSRHGSHSLPETHGPMNHFFKMTLFQWVPGWAVVGFVRSLLVSAALHLRQTFFPRWSLQPTLIILAGAWITWNQLMPQPPHWGAEPGPFFKRKKKKIYIYLKAPFLLENSNGKLELFRFGVWQTLPEWNASLSLPGSQPMVFATNDTAWVFKQKLEFGESCTCLFELDSLLVLKDQRWY